MSEKKKYNTTPGLMSNGYFDEASLKRLKRDELVDIILKLNSELNTQKAENEKLISTLTDKRIRLQNVGSVAEAALSITGVLDKVQEAADIYMSEVQLRGANAEAKSKTLIDDAKAQADYVVGDAKAQANYIVRDAKINADKIIKKAQYQASYIDKRVKEEMKKRIDSFNEMLRQAMDTNFNNKPNNFEKG